MRTFSICHNLNTMSTHWHELWKRRVWMGALWSIEHYYYFQDIPTSIKLIAASAIVWKRRAKRNLKRKIKCVQNFFFGHGVVYCKCCIKVEQHWKHTHSHTLATHGCNFPLFSFLFLLPWSMEAVLHTVHIAQWLHCIQRDFIGFKLNYSRQQKLCGCAGIGLYFYYWHRRFIDYHCHCRSSLCLPFSLCVCNEERVVSA